MHLNEIFKYVICCCRFYFFPNAKEIRQATMVGTMKAKRMYKLLEFVQVEYTIHGC